MEYEISNRPAYALVEVSLERGEDIVAEPGAMVSYSHGIGVDTETGTSGAGGHLVAWDDVLERDVHRPGGLKSTVLSEEGKVAEFDGDGRIWLQTRNFEDFVSYLAGQLPSAGGGDGGAHIGMDEDEGFDKGASRSSLPVTGRAPSRLLPTASRLSDCPGPQPVSPGPRPASSRHRCWCTPS